MGTIPIPGAEIYYEKNFLSPGEATTLFNVLRTKCAWERRRSSFNYTGPRDEAYYGDPGTKYIYSRREYKPLAWIPGTAPLEDSGRRGHSRDCLFQLGFAEAGLQRRTL